MAHKEYSVIVISDNSLVILKLNFPGNMSPPRMWRLNNKLLADDDFTEFISSQIDFFLELNDTPDISSGILGLYTGTNNSIQCWSKEKKDETHHRIIEGDKRS